MEHGSFTAPIGPISRDKQDFSWGIEATTTMMFAGKDGWNMVEQSLKKSSNNAQAGANFQNLVRTIASRVEGWTVELWCWRSSCHSCYKRTSDPVSFMWLWVDLKGYSKILWTCLPYDIINIIYIYIIFYYIYNIIYIILYIYIYIFSIYIL